jgi:UDP-4-amino-4-deoxy-L-arabinose-oxoglutarate aminotransferase
LNDYFLPLCRPSFTESEIRAVVDVLRSGWITTGARSQELEQGFCREFACNNAVALSSATAGMHLLLHALGLGPGDEVITPSLTWVSTVNLITLIGATPVFADVDRDTLMVTPELVEPCISPRTRLIVPVHFAGAALDLEPLRALARRHGIALVEDAAHALGTRYGDAAVGRDGTAIFSFHAIKNVTTGEGGMLCTDDAFLAERVRRLRFHGLGADAFDRARGGRAPQAEVLEPGYKYNLPDMNAVLGVGQLARLGEINRRRSELARLYADYLAQIEEVLPLAVPDYPMQHAWHLYVIRLDTERARVTRDEFMRELKVRGIGTGIHFRAVHTQRFYRETIPVPKDRLQNTIWNSGRLCSLPLFPDMTEGDVSRVASAIKTILSKAAA